MLDSDNKIIIGSDHGAFELKEHIKEILTAEGVVYSDIGTNSTESVDYPTYIGRVAGAVSKGEFNRGIAMCGTGIGASITANRFPRVRASLCTNVKMAEMTRRHNNSNILVMGGRITSFKEAEDILRTWLSTEYDGGRHEKRLKMIESAVTKYC